MSKKKQNRKTENEIKNQAPLAESEETGTESAEVFSENPEETKDCGEQNTEPVKSDIDELLKAKEERFYGKNREEEPEEEEKIETPFGNFKKKIGFFIDYYKWFVIIPAIIIVIAVVMIVSYLSESRERALELSIMNASFEIPEVIYAVENDYTDYAENEISAKDIRIEINLEYPDTRMMENQASQSEVISMQKFNAMVISGRVDVAVTNTWVIDEYSVSDATLDLRELFDEDFLEKHADKIYYSKDSTGERIPVAFYLDSELIRNVYEDDVIPLAVSFDSSKHREETKRFMEWLLDEQSAY